MGEEHAEHLVGLSRIQRLMLSLMPKYCSIANWKLLLKETERDMVWYTDVLASCTLDVSTCVLLFCP